MEWRREKKKKTGQGRGEAGFLWTSPEGKRRRAEGGRAGKAPILLALLRSSSIPSSRAGVHGWMQGCMRPGPSSLLPPPPRSTSQLPPSSSLRSQGKANLSFQRLRSWAASYEQLLQLLPCFWPFPPTTIPHLSIHQLIPVRQPMCARAASGLKRKVQKVQGPSTDPHSISTPVFES